MTLLQIEELTLLFFIYSFGGWMIESLGSIVTKKKFVNRGFLLGPYCPIYGIGVILITLLLSKYKEDLVALFFLSAILCGVLEYFTSFLMEKFFKARWWDYSNMKYNINGRICLENLILFAFAGVITLNFSNPLFEAIFQLLPPLALHITTGFLLSLFLIDCIISLNIMNSVKHIRISISNTLKDNTDEISANIRAVLMQKSAPYRRILSAFPQAFADKIKESKEKIEKTAQKVKTDISEAKEKAMDNLHDAKLKAIDNLQEVKNKALDSLQEKKENTLGNIQEAKENTEKFLKKYKLKTKLSLKKLHQKNNQKN